MGNQLFPIYGELPAPEDGVFPFDHELLQWMAEYVADSQRPACPEA